MLSKRCHFPSGNRLFLSVGFPEFTPSCYSPACDRTYSLTVGLINRPSAINRSTNGFTFSIWPSLFARSRTPMVPVTVRPRYFEPNRAPARCLSNFCIIIEGCPSPGQSFFVLFPCFHLTAQMRSILFSNPVFSFTLVKTT